MYTRKDMEVVRTSKTPVSERKKKHPGPEIFTARLKSLEGVKGKSPSEIKERKRLRRWTGSGLMDVAAIEDLNRKLEGES